MEYSHPIRSDSDTSTAPSPLPVVISDDERATESSGPLAFRRRRYESDCSASPLWQSLTGPISPAPTMSSRGQRNNRDEGGPMTHLLLRQNGRSSSVESAAGATCAAARLVGRGWTCVGRGMAPTTLW